MNDVHVSVDIEADGPIPGPNSMFEVGACVASTLCGSQFQPADPDEKTFSASIRPLPDATPDPETRRWITEHRLSYDGPGAISPHEAMSKFASWVDSLRGPQHRHPVFIAYPLSFDWMFSHWYFERFLGVDPFGFSSAICMKSMYIAKAGTPMSQSSKKKMRPNRLTRTRFRHTHDGLDDAKGQAELFCKLWEWGGPGSAAGST